MDEFEGHQGPGAAGVVALDRAGGVGGDPGEGAVVVVVRRRLGREPACDPACDQGGYDRERKWYGADLNGYGSVPGT